jgi:ammonium transporter, Amt family
MRLRRVVLLAGAAVAVACGPAHAAAGPFDLAPALNLAWLLIAAFLVMFMQAGFALLETGFSRAKNALHTSAMNLVIYPIGLLGFFLTGYALMLGGTAGLAPLGTTHLSHRELTIAVGAKQFGLLGLSKFALLGVAGDPGSLAMFLFGAVFMNVAATIVIGALVERWKFSAFFVYGFFMSMFLYPLYANWLWGGGWLAQLGRNFGLGHGAVDFAGSAVVHMTGGLTALAGTLVLGPRIGRFKRDRVVGALPGHNLPMAMVGTLILAFGWFGLNCGSTLAGADPRIALIAVNTALAGATGALAALLSLWHRFKKPDVTVACNGLLGGLAAISGSCAYVSPLAAAIIGLLSGLLVVTAVLALEMYLGVDDPVGSIAVHGVGGMWGALAVGIFADGTYGMGLNGVPGGVRGVLFGDSGQFIAQLAAIAAAAVAVFGLALLFFVALERMIGNRVPAEVELSGLDELEMGGEAYPKN